MVFITAGMGGGTGTGAAPIIAKQARELGILTIGIVTIPFSFEGRKRVEQAMEGVDELSNYVDALLIICNEKLRDMYGDLKLSKAFEMADNVLTIAAKSIAEIITLKGFVNVDFADVEVVMRNSGVALMGAGESVGENRALEAAKMALESPLLNSNDIRGASNILLNMLYGSKEITMDEITLITDYVKELVGNDVDVIWGAGKDDALGDELHVAVIATGFNGRIFLSRWRPWKIWRCRRWMPGSWRKRSGCASKNWRKVVGCANSEVNSGGMSGNVNGLSCLTTMMTMNRFGKRRLTGNESKSTIGSLNWRTGANGEKMRCRM
jgi:cell division protein FtsZ